MLVCKRKEKTCEQLCQVSTSSTVPTQDMLVFEGRWTPLGVVLYGKIIPYAQVICCMQRQVRGGLSLLYPTERQVGHKMSCSMEVKVTHLYFSTLFSIVFCPMDRLQWLKNNTNNFEISSLVMIMHVKGGWATCVSLRSRLFNKTEPTQFSECTVLRHGPANIYLTTYCWMVYMGQGQCHSFRSAILICFRYIIFYYSFRKSLFCKIRASINNIWSPACKQITVQCAHNIIYSRGREITMISLSRGWQH